MNLTAPVRGALWMLGAAFLFSCMIATIKPVATELHPFEIAFFQHFISVGFMAPWILRHAGDIFGTKRLGLYALRGALALGTVLLWYSAVPELPLGDAIALNFTAPLFGAISAVLFLGEKVGWRRWGAFAAGFAGMLIVVRPGFAHVGLATLMMLGSSAIWGVQHAVLKMLSRVEKVSVIICFHALFSSALVAIPAILVWSWPSANALAWLFAMSAFGTLAHVCLTRSMAVADASFVLPFDFAKLPFGTMLAAMFFAERPDPWTWAGAAVIVAANAYIARREAVAARTARRAGEAPRP